MRWHLFILGLVFFLKSCQFIETREKQAIDICKNSKIQFAENDIFQYFGLPVRGLSQDSKWIEFANSLAKDDPNSKYKWDAREIEDTGVFLVSFTDETNWGQNWEVSIEQQIVKHINSNEFLSRKYGFSRLDKESEFEIVELGKRTLSLQKKNSYFSTEDSKDIVFTFNGKVINNSDKTLISSDLSGELQLIFKEKVISGSQEWKSGFKRKATKSRPWRPNETLEFSIRTSDIEEIYLQFEPEFVFFVVNLSVEDPIGFTYNKAIGEYDLMDEWKNLKESVKKKKENQAASELIPSTETSKPKVATNQAVTTKPSPINGEEKTGVETKKSEPTKTVTTPAKSEAEATTQKVPEPPKIDQRAVMGAGGTSGKGTQPASGGAQGTSNAKGDEGKPTSTVDGRAVMGEGSGKGANSGAGYSLDLTGWDFASRPNINDRVSIRSGRIVFKITIDSVGKVIQAIPLEFNVTNEVLSYYRQVVNQINFRKQSGAAADFSTGKITFIIKVD
ncbi:hypothetical protein [Algoriphagus sp.]|uniref:hypothetical protein n=1 Tax=Algoriphagus sp. TaxID=1872435 RepID=UPI00351DF956